MPGFSMRKGQKKFLLRNLEWRDKKEEDKKDSAQRAGRQCTYSSTRGGEESREWWNKGAPSVQLTPIVWKNLKISETYFPHINSKMIGKLKYASKFYKLELSAS